MAMAATHVEWTVDMLDALPDDGNRYEIIDGVLFVTPSPLDPHQLVAGELYARLKTYLRRSSAGRARIAPSDVRREDRQRNRVQPDVYAVRLVDGRLPAYPFALQDLLLVAEVESHSNAQYDYQTKRKLYLAAGIPEYWIVSPEAQTFVRWKNGQATGEIITDRIEWHPQGMAEPLVIEIPEFFEEAFA